MKRSVKRVIGYILAGILTVSMLAGCGNNAGAGKSTGDGGDNSSGSDVVTLKWYMSLDKVDADTDKVIEALNEYTREKIGVEIDYTIITSSDYSEKMPTLINSGESFDICFTSNWNTNYLQFATQGGFMDITELLPEYAPETYEFIPEELWAATEVDGKNYAIPSYKALGWQAGFMVNSDMAEAYGIDLSKVKTLKDYTEVLKVVEEKTNAEGKDVIGTSGMKYSLAVPYESLVGAPDIPGASAVSHYNNFTDKDIVFNQYDTQEYKDYCALMREWYMNGYMKDDPINYMRDTAKVFNDFASGKLFSRIIKYAPGTAEAETVSTGHGVEFIPLMDPLFTTEQSMGGLMAVSSNSKHPEKAVEFLNLLNSDLYIGTLMRHGIEGEHYTTVGDKQIDRTKNGTLNPDDNGYDYTFGWQFGTVFNQKWDISYPANIEELFTEYNNSAVTAPNVGFTVDRMPVDAEMAALTSVIEEYGPALETGMVDPDEYIPEFIQKLEDNGVNILIEEINKQLEE